VFRRRRAGDDVDEVDALDDEPDDDDEDEDELAERSQTVLPQPTTGPWDEADLPEDDEKPRVDLGGLAVPIPQGIDLQVQVENDIVVAVALVEGGSQLVVNAFAAPKSAGLWADVRGEIVDSLRTSGGSAEPADGPFGPELRARIPDGTGGHQQARFVGVDGPRWFLRGLLTGPAATDTLQAKRLENVFRDIVVVRGGDAMAPRDALPLHLPREAIEQIAEANPEDRQLQLQERGPEITETR
jgi:Protein of unknown function (DUF3710)